MNTAAAKPKPGTWEALSPQTLSEDLNTWPSMCLSSYGPVREQPCILTDTDICPEELHLFALQDFASTGTVQNFFGGLQGEVDKASRKLAEMQSRGPQAIVGHMQSQRIDHSRPLPDISPCPRLKKSSMLNNNNIAFMQPNYRPALNNPFEILNRPENKFGANVNAFGSPGASQGFGNGVPKTSLNPTAFTQFSSQPTSNPFINPDQPEKEKASTFSFAQSLSNLEKQSNSSQSPFSASKPAAPKAPGIFEASAAKTAPQPITSEQKPSSSAFASSSTPFSTSGIPSGAATAGTTPQPVTSAGKESSFPAFASFSTLSTSSSNFSGKGHTLSENLEKHTTPQAPQASTFSAFGSVPAQPESDSKPKFSFAEKLASMASTTPSNPTDASSEVKPQEAPAKPAGESYHEVPKEPTEANKPNSEGFTKPPAQETAGPNPAFLVPPNTLSPFFKAPIETSHAKISQLVTPSQADTPPINSHVPPTTNQVPPSQHSQEGVPAKEPQKSLTPDEVCLVNALNALHEYKEEFSALDINGLVNELDKMLSAISIRPSFSPMVVDDLPIPSPFKPTPTPASVRNLPAYKSLPPLPPPTDPQRAHAKLGDPASYSTQDSLAPWEIEAFTSSDFTPGAIPTKPPSIGLLFRKN